MNIIVISVDTLRADHLSCYGYPRKTSPNIDALAADGVLFTSCISCSCHTTPAYTSMVSGQEPFHHGVIATLWAVRNDIWQRLDDRTPTLPEVLYVEGWRTWAVDNLLHFAAFPSWHARGYRYYINVNPPSRQAHVTADEINAEVLPLLDRVDWEGDNFIFIHYWDPHGPYNQPEGFRNIFPRDLGDLPRISTPDGRRYVKYKGPEDVMDEALRHRLCLYDEEIFYCDTRVGQVLEKLRRLGAYDEALVMLNADHGEDMAEHEAWFDHRQPYEGVIRVPLIVKLPAHMGGDEARGKQVDALVTHTDLMPTILDAAGMSWRYGPIAGRSGDGWTLNIDGHSLLPLIRGEVEGVREHVVIVGCFFRWRGKYKCCEVAVRTAERKLIVRSPVPPGDYDMADLAGMLHKDRGLDWRVFNTLPVVELVDWKRDPTELANLAESEPDAVSQLMAKLRPVLASHLWAGGQSPA